MISITAKLISNFLHNTSYLFFCKICATNLDTLSIAHRKWKKKKENNSMIHVMWMSIFDFEIYFIHLVLSNYLKRNCSPSSSWSRGWISNTPVNGNGCPPYANSVPNISTPEWNTPRPKFVVYSLIQYWWSKKKSFLLFHSHFNWNVFVICCIYLYILPYRKHWEQLVHGCPYWMGVARRYRYPLARLSNLEMVNYTEDHWKTSQDAPVCIE